MSIRKIIIRPNLDIMPANVFIASWLGPLIIISFNFYFFQRMCDENNIRFLKTSCSIISQLILEKENLNSIDEQEIALKREQSQIIQKEIEALEIKINKNKKELVRMKNLSNDFKYSLKNNNQIYEKDTLLWKLINE